MVIPHIFIRRRVPLGHGLVVKHLLRLWFRFERRWWRRWWRCSDHWMRRSPKALNVLDRSRSDRVVDLRHLLILYRQQIGLLGNQRVLLGCRQTSLARAHYRCLQPPAACRFRRLPFAIPVTGTPGSGAAPHEQPPGARFAFAATTQNLGIHSYPRNEITNTHDRRRQKALPYWVALVGTDGIVGCGTSCTACAPLRVCSPGTPCCPMPSCPDWRCQI
jgi:hypothetical protein